MLPSTSISVLELHHCRLLLLVLLAVEQRTHGCMSPILVVFASSNVDG